MNNRVFPRLTLIGSQEMEVGQHLENDALVLTLQGTTFSDLTSEWLKRIIACYERSDFKKLILDFSRVRYLNSLGIAVLLYARKTMQRTGRDLILTGINEHAREILRRTSLLNRFRIESAQQLFPIISDLKSESAATSCPVE